MLALYHCYHENRDLDERQRDCGRVVKPRLMMEVLDGDAVNERGAREDMGHGPLVWMSDECKDGHQ